MKGSIGLFTSGDKNMGFLSFFNSSSSKDEHNKIELAVFPLTQQKTYSTEDDILKWAKAHCKNIEHGKAVLTQSYKEVKAMDLEIEELERKKSEFEAPLNGVSAKVQDFNRLNDLILEKNEYDKAIKSLQNSVHKGIDVLSKALQKYKEQGCINLLKKLYKECPKIEEFLQDYDKVVDINSNPIYSKSLVS